MNDHRTDAAAAVSWQMDQDAATDLSHVLGILEDFLRLASHEVIDELAALPIARPIDASRWAHWLADYLGEQGIALRAAARAATDSTPNGDLP